MDLTTGRIQEYLDLLSLSDPGDRIGATAASIRAQVESGQRILSRTKVLEHDGILIATIRGEPIDPATWILTELKIRPGLPPSLRDAATGLIREALGRIESEGARSIESRISVSRTFPAYTETLLGVGFTRHGGRIEFTSDVADLPGEDGTPFGWSAVGAMALPDAAALLDRVSAGDPDHDPTEEWGSLLPALLGDTYLNGNPECVHIGCIGDETAAVVVTQVAPTTGWSRITYMGLLPSWRGRGLGRWVHLHGFQMMREQGGKTYQGGCASGNVAMIALFQRHGCRELIVYDVWKWRR